VNFESVIAVRARDRNRSKGERNEAGSRWKRLAANLAEMTRCETARSAHPKHADQSIDVDSKALSPTA